VGAKDAHVQPTCIQRDQWMYSSRPESDVRWYWKGESSEEVSEWLLAFGKVWGTGGVQWHVNYE
jgi:hypothetical protein